MSGERLDDDIGFQGIWPLAFQRMWSVDQNSRVRVDRTIVTCEVVPYVGTLVTEWSSLERSLAVEFRQGWDRYMVARGTAFIWNTDVLKQENPSCGGWTRILLDPCLV